MGTYGVGPRVPGADSTNSRRSKIAKVGVALFANGLLKLANVSARAFGGRGAVFGRWASSVSFNADSRGFAVTPRALGTGRSWAFPRTVAVDVRLCTFVVAADSRSRGEKQEWLRAPPDTLASCACPGTR